MASLRCRACEVRWPKEDRFHICPACGTVTAVLNVADPDDDWEPRYTKAMKNASPEAKIAQMRLDRFLAAGLDIGRSITWASAAVDLHLFERLRKQGCAVEVAARIVAPLPTG